MELADRFYSAPEVANILGVTLRSLYRYIRDGKIETFKTAGGRLRFTRESVLSFMGPSIRKEQAAPVYREPSPRIPSYRAPVRPAAFSPEVEEEDVAEEPRRYAPVAPKRSVSRREEVAPVRPLAKPVARPVTRPVMTTSLYEEEEEAVEEAPTINTSEQAPRQLYYQSSIKDLRLLAQKIQKSCQNAHVPYALTGYAGMSLHREMPPFSVIHVYANFDDLPFFENILQCHEVSNEDEANLGFLEVTDLGFWQKTETFKGFKVATQDKLNQDLSKL